MNWKAKWIWLDYITPWAINKDFHRTRVVGVLPSEKNRFGLFRKTFDIGTKAPDHAIMKISVDSRYMLYINEQYVGRGIYRCNKHNWYYDEYDVARYLLQGKNVICIVVQYLGTPLSWYEMFPHGGISGRTIGKGGLIFQLDIPPAEDDQEPVTISSDGTTRAHPCDAWRQDTPLIYVGLAYVEIFDARKMPEGWLSADFDDSDRTSWGHVIELEIKDILPNMIKCDIPRLEESRVRASHIVSAGMIQEYFSEDDIEESLTDPASDPIDFFTQLAMSTYKSGIADLDNTWQASGPLEVDLGEGPVGIVFDMGRDVSGHVYLDLVSEMPGTIIDIAWSEKLDAGRRNMLVYTRPFSEMYGSRFTCKAGENHHELFHWYGFRYLQLNIKGQGKVSLQDIGTNLFLYSVPEATFECDDERLNALYKACTWTLRNCMHDGYEDCPSREQRQWLGDASVEIMTCFATFGDTALARKLIVQCAQSQRGDGLTDMCTPGDADVHGLIIPDYCLYWINEIYQYYWYTGDLDFVVQMLPSMLRAIKWFIQYINPGTGLLENLPYWIFIDWSVNDKWGACCPLNAQLYITIKQLAEMGRLAGWNAAVDHLDTIAEGIASGINLYLWNEERGAYVDAVIVDDSGNIEKQSKKVSFHSNALVIVHDIAPPDRVALIIENVFEKQYSEMFVMNQEPLWKGITASKFEEENNVIVAEPFFFHHVNQAFAKLNRYDLIMRFLRDGWCKMLDHDATTIWETWGWGGSHCHAWSTTPAHDLVRHVLGVLIDAPGATRVLINPHPVELTRAKGKVPTIKGMVEVEWSLDSSKQILSIDVAVPDEVSLAFGEPSIDGKIATKIVEEKSEDGKTTHVEFQF